MPKISEYTGGRFASQVVGTPGADRSGSIMAQGAQELAQAIRRREDAGNSLKAMSHFGKFRLDYETKKEQLFQQYRDDPFEYPEAVREATRGLVDEYGSEMSGDTRNRFQQLTTSMLAQDSESLAKQAFARDEEIKVGSVLDNYQNQALLGASVRAPEGLVGVLAGFDAVSLEAQKIISPKADAELNLRYRKMAVENALMTQVNEQPSRLLGQLKSKDSVYAKVLTPDEINTYANRARTAIDNRAEDELYRSMYSAQGRLLDLQKQVDDGTVTVAELIAEREAAVANKDITNDAGKKIVKPGYLEGLDTLIAQRTMTNQKIMKGRDEPIVTSAEFKKRWDEYLTDKQQDGKKAGEEDVEKELDMYAGLVQEYNSGRMLKSDFDESVRVMRTRLALRVNQVPLVKSFDEAIAQAGTQQKFFWRQKGDDIVSIGYTMIKDFLDKAYPGKSDEDRFRMKAQMLSQYHEAIENLPEEQVKRLKDRTSKEAYARQVIYGTVADGGGRQGGLLLRNMTYQDPQDSRVYYVGDTKQEYGGTKIFRGLDTATGKPVWVLSESSRNKPTVIEGRQYKIVGVNQEGKMQFIEATNE